MCLLLGVGCAPEDVCTDRNHDECEDPNRECIWEAGTIQCLQRCEDGAGCPIGQTCIEEGTINHCQPGQDCLEYAIVVDVCRPESD